MPGYAKKDKVLSQVQDFGFAPDTFENRTFCSSQGEEYVEANTLTKHSAFKLLDPRTKLLLTMLFTTLVFMVDVLIVAGAQMALFLCLYLAAGIPAKKIIFHGKFMLPLIGLVIGLQILFGQGLLTGLMISCRIITLSLLMPLLIMTTDASLLALGITRLGLNYKAAYIITSTLNLIPLFEEEARKIMDARRLRGMKSVKLREYPAIAFPLMIKALRQAQITGLVMDTRAFGAYKTRTWLREIQFTAVDYGAFAAGTVWAVIAISANFFLKR